MDIQYGADQHNADQSKKSTLPRLKVINKSYIGTRVDQPATQCQKINIICNEENLTEGSDSAESLRNFSG